MKEQQLILLGRDGHRCMAATKFSKIPERTSSAYELQQAF
jgi:hypothetical protein